MSVHWPSFWLGLFMPSMFVLALMVVLGVLSDVLNWLAPSREEPW